MQKGISEWIHNWKRRGWKTASKEPVKNEDLWRRLDALAAGHTIEWRWVKGHAGHPDNERVDALARAGLEQVRRAGKAIGGISKRVTKKSDIFSDGDSRLKTYEEQARESSTRA